MRAFVQKVRPWAGPLLAYSLVALVLVAVSAHPLWAQDILSTAETKVKKSIQVGGWLMVAGGIVAGIKAGLKIAEDGRGWAGIGVSIFLMIAGWKIAQSASGDGVTGVIGTGN